MTKDRVIVMGAAGRDFHNFNVYFRHNSLYEVAAVSYTHLTLPTIREV